MKAGQGGDFERAWHDLTVAIRTHRGSLGSRLHRSADGTYLAYAQWPSRERYQESGELPPEAQQRRAVLRQCCESLEIVFEGDMTEDLLDLTGR